MKKHKYKAKPGWYDASLTPCDKKDGVYYFHSQLEVRTAKELQLLKKAGKIIWWKHHPEIWDFNTRRDTPYRANSSYRPDFKVAETEFNMYWIEDKGYNYSGSLTKIKRACKLFPERKLLIKTTNNTYLAKDYLERMKR